MKIISIVTSILIMTIAFVANAAAGAAAGDGQNIRDGISGIQWGAKPDTVEGPTKRHQKGDIVYLKRPGERFMLKGLDLGSVLYGFFENKFFAAFMRIRSQDDAGKLKAILSADYGPMRRQFRVSETVYIWDFHDIKIKLKERENDTVFKLALYYKPLSTKLNESKVDKDFEIKMDLVPDR